MDGELEQGGHKEAFPAAETAKRPINQSWETWQQRGFRTTDSSRATAPRTQVALFPVHQLLSTALHLGPRRLTRSCTEMLEIINIYQTSFLHSLQVGRQQRRAPQERKKGSSSSIYVLTNTSSLRMVQRSQKFVTAKEKASFAFIYQIQ